MQSLFENKRWVIILTVLALGALVLLSSGLSGVTFREGQSFTSEKPETMRVAPSAVIRSVTGAPLLLQLGAWALIAVVVILIGFLMTPEGRKRLLRLLFRVAVTYWVLYLFLTRYPEVLAGIGLGGALTAPQQNTPESAGAPPAFTPPQAISWTTYLISFGVAVLLVIFARKMYSTWKEARQLGEDSSVKKLARIARSSIKDLSSGRESTDVIINCYFHMSDVVADKRQLERGHSMTPSEFIARLEHIGLPRQAVQTLTRLFESVRYGGRKASPVMVNEAVASLTLILNHLGEAV